MAIINALREKYASGVKTFNFTPRAGTAAIVEKIMIDTSAADFAQINCANTLLGVIEIGPKERNHLAYVSNDDDTINFMDYLKTKGIETEIPVPEGQVFSITTTNNFDNLIVRYREVDPGDVKEGMPNYPGGEQQIKLLYGTNASAITASRFYALDKSLNPAEMHNWPFQENGCPFKKISVKTIGILNVSENNYPSSVDAISNTTKVRFRKGTTQLFTSEADGFLTIGTGAASGSANTVYGQGINELPYVPSRSTGEMFFLPEPLEFVRDDEFAIEVYCDIATNGQIDAGDLRALMIGTVGGK